MEHPNHEELTEFLYEELDGSRQSEIARHVAACEECRARVDSWQGIRRALHGWELTQRDSFSLQAPRRAALPLGYFRTAIAAMLLLAVGYGLARATAPTPDFSQLRADLSRQLHVEFQAELTRAASQLEARRVADYVSLRQDVETVAVQTQEGFDSLAYSDPSQKIVPAVYQVPQNKK